MLLYPYMQSVGILKAFFTPARSLIKTTTQTAGGADFEAIFNVGTLLYQPVAYILFVVFLVVMPVLFRTMLVSIHLKTHSGHIGNRISIISAIIHNCQQDIHRYYLTGYQQMYCATRAWRL